MAVQHTDALFAVDLQGTAGLRTLAALQPAQPAALLLRDGEVVLFRRKHSVVFQCRYKLADGTWHRRSTGKAAIEHAVAAACNIYDEARFRQRLGLAHRAQNFAQIAALALADLRRRADASNGRTAAHDYITCIERYFVPYFGERMLEELTHTDIREFEVWRDRQMRRKPATSTLNNFTSAWNKIISTAVEQGIVSERVPVPKLTARGAKSKARPAFTEDEIDKLLPYMEQWQLQGRLSVEREIRPLLRDYVEFLLYTGVRHGTEAMNIRWQHIEWHTHKGTRYLRVWVSGKTGGRWLIAKHAARAPLQRLHGRQRDICGMSFESLLQSRAQQLVFRFSDGYQPQSLVGTFRKLMRDCGLLKDSDGQNRTLYSLRHTYATFALLRNETDIHTLSKQMGNSASMIERHYSKLTATLAADRLA
jgi:integrase